MTPALTYSIICGWFILSALPGSGLSEKTSRQEKVITLAENIDGEKSSPISLTSCHISVLHRISEAKIGNITECSFHNSPVYTED